MAYLAQAHADRKEEHAKLFAEWFAKQPRKSTSAVLTDEAYNEIRSFLLGKTSSTKVMRRRITRNMYRLIDYPALGLKNRICVPSGHGHVDSTDSGGSGNVSIKRLGLDQSLTLVFEYCQYIR